MNVIEQRDRGPEKPRLLLTDETGSGTYVSPTMVMRLGIRKVDELPKKEWFVHPSTPAKTMFVNHADALRWWLDQEDGL